MTINTKMRRTILASAFALVVAAPAAIAQDSGTWYKDIHTDPALTDGVSLSHSRALMEKKIATPAAIVQDSGTWYKDTHTDPALTDGVRLSHSRALMEKKIVPSRSAGNQVERFDELLNLSRIGG